MRTLFTATRIDRSLDDIASPLAQSALFVNWNTRKTPAVKLRVLRLFIYTWTRLAGVVQGQTIHFLYSVLCLALFVVLVHVSFGWSCLLSIYRPSRVWARCDFSHLRHLYVSSYEMSTMSFLFCTTALRLWSHLHASLYRLFLKHTFWKNIPTQTLVGSCYGWFKHDICTEHCSCKVLVLF